MRCLEGYEPFQFCHPFGEGGKFYTRSGSSWYAVGRGAGALAAASSFLPRCWGSWIRLNSSRAPAP